MKMQHKEEKARSYAWKSWKLANVLQVSNSRKAYNLYTWVQEPSRHDKGYSLKKYDLYQGWCIVKRIRVTEENKCLRRDK
jgi:hypothetical protein